MTADSASALIAGRALMGVGAALIFPATLAIITNMFRDPSERAKAIGIWSAVSGMAVAAGPITGGWLLEHFWWGSVFFVNVPDRDRSPSSRHGSSCPSRGTHDAPPLDKLGRAALDRRHHAPSCSRSSKRPSGVGRRSTTIAGFAIAAVLLGDVRVVGAAVAAPDAAGARSSRNLRFSAASVAITAAFFALFGFIFLITQYFQLVRGYGPLEAGVRTLPVAFAIAGASIARAAAGAAVRHDPSRACRARR